MDEIRQLDLTQWQRQSLLEQAFDITKRPGKPRYQDVETSYKFELTNGRLQRSIARRGLGSLESVLNSPMNARGLGPWAYEVQDRTKEGCVALLNRERDNARRRNRRGIASLTNSR